VCVNACGVGGMCTLKHHPHGHPTLFQPTHTTPHALTHTGGCLYSFLHYSWRWTGTLSETCRVLINQVKQKLQLVGYLLIRYFKDARYHEHKIKEKKVF